MNKNQQFLIGRYYNPRSEGSYGGVERLRKSTREPRRVVENWLSHQDSYTLHKPVRIHFPRRKTIVAGIREQYQCDLIDVQRLKRENDGCTFILTCIDVFSKMAYARSLKNKTSTSVIPALQSVFKEGGKPRYLQTDRGTEFLNSKVQTYLRKEGIEHFTSYNDTIKAAVVERFNRTLKERLWRYFTRTKNVRFIEALPKVVESYNKSYHRSIKRRPIDVNVRNQEEVWETLYERPSSPQRRATLQAGNRVRLSNTRQNFKKGYLPSWTEELFTISRVLNTTPYTYVVKDDHGEELTGSFYRYELQKVGDKEEYRIDDILQERKGVRGQTEVLIKWRGYPDSFNSWIPKQNLRRYND